MSKALSITGAAIALLMALVFGLDLAIAVPFGQQSVVMDIGMLLAGLILAALGFLTFREQR